MSRLFTPPAEEHNHKHTHMHFTSPNPDERWHQIEDKMLKVKDKQQHKQDDTEEDTHK